ncbi:MAG TPA: hypothetical protein PLZ57_06135 [Pseudobdellovibrionaceae bacterium]|nr:hypothetical protein [Pseudobdellovibrionaceae bacterium]
MSKPSTVLPADSPIELSEAYGSYPQLWMKRPYWPVNLRHDLNLNCANCRMLNVGDGHKESLAVWPRRDWGPFLPQVKCCAHQPYWPNYLLGAALHDANGSGHSHLAVLLEQSELTPWGARPLPKRRTAEARSGQCGYGQDLELACPMLTREGQCSAWRFRPATCSTYVCQSAHAVSGLAAWREYEGRLVAWESELAHQLVWQLGYTNDDLRESLSHSEALNIYRRCHELLRSGWAP